MKRRQSKWLRNTLRLPSWQSGGSVRRDYIRKLIRMGVLSAVKLGGWKIRWDEVYRFEKDQEKRDAEMLRQQRVGFIL